MQGHHDEQSGDWQDSDRGQATSQRIDALEELLAQLDSIGPE
jgi:hypothetical protein